MAPRRCRGAARLLPPLLAAALLPSAPALAGAGEAAEAEDPRLAPFLGWIRGFDGADVAGLDLRHSEQRGWHAVAARDAAEGDVVATVPWAAVLQGDRMSAVAVDGGEAADPGTAALQAAGMAEYSGEFQLMLKVLAEARLGARSAWRAHLAMVPQGDGAFRTGLWWDEDDARCASPHARAQQQYQGKQYEAFAAATTALLGDAAVTDAEMRWAYSVAMTRALHQENGEALLVPFVDMLNHDGSAQQDAVEVVVTERGATLVVPAGGRLTKGHEVTLSYGAHLTPAKLLVYYGFADTTFSRVYSHLEFPRNENTTALEAAGCYDRDALWVDRDGATAAKVLECVLIAVLPADERAAYADLSADAKAAALAARRTDVLQVYGQHVTQVLGSYPHKWDPACDTEHHFAPLIRDANTRVRAAFLRVKDAIDEELRESGTMRRVVTTQQQEAKKKRRRRKDKGEKGADPMQNTEAFAKWMEEHKQEKREKERRRREEEAVAEGTAGGAATE